MNRNHVLGITNPKNYLQVRRTYKKKNMKYEMYLMELFHFNYAGKAEVFITYKRNIKKYDLIITGVHIVEDTFCFTPKYIKHYEFDTLYFAILAFQLVVKILCNSMDWYYPEMFNSINVYDEITIGRE